MPQKVNYYAVLSRAVSTLERDAFGARGAIYDREHRAMLRRLALADPRCTEEEIAEEEQAFRDAIRRIEFREPIARVSRAEAPPVPRDLDARREERTIVWREPEREPSGRPEREGRREREPTPREERRERQPTPREQRWRRAAEEEIETDPRGSRIEPPRRAAPESDYDYEEAEGPPPARSKPIFRRIVVGAQVAVLLGVAGLLGYAYWNRDIDLGSLFAMPDAFASSQRAAL